MADCLRQSGPHTDVETRFSERLLHPITVAVGDSDPPEKANQMEHIPAMHAAKVGMRYPARVATSSEYGMHFEIDTIACAPGHVPILYACLLWAQTIAPEAAQALTRGQKVEVVLIHIVQDYTGDLYVSLPADPAWLTWNSGTVRQLARRIRDTGETVLLPVLADALEEAGCTDAALLDHCRQSLEGQSWVVDLLATQE